MPLRQSRRGRRGRSRLRDPRRTHPGGALPALGQGPQTARVPHCSAGEGGRGGEGGGLGREGRAGGVRGNEGVREGVREGEGEREGVREGGSERGRGVVIEHVGGVKDEERNGRGRKRKEEEKRG